MNDLDVIVVQGGGAVVSRKLGVPTYDFDFRGLLAGRSQRYDEVLPEAILRVGPVADYAAVQKELADRGVTLVNDVEAHRRASALTSWYPRIQDLTPESMVVEDPEGVGQSLGWPVFVKGDRQTNRHDASLAIARSPEELARIIERSRMDSILGWQELVVRRFLQLRKVRERAPGGLQASFEFRTFWWRGELLDAGPYWSKDAPFWWTPSERSDALQVAQEAALRVDVPFLMVDVAQDVDGRWWVIECNDAQESSYAGCSPLRIWQRWAGFQAEEEEPNDA